ncbi:electron transfer flavoprotein subunit alpha/FixB family protein [Chloroflexota bacterium]
MAEYEGVLIGGEVVAGRVTTVTRELLSTARRLGDSLSQPVSILFLGEDVQEVAREAILLGADKSYVVAGPHADQLHADYYAELLAVAVKQVKPFVILMGQTDIGRDTAPRLGASLGSPVTLDCIALDIDPETKLLLQTRPVYGGKAMAVWVSEHKPQVITMRPRSMMPADPDISRNGEIMELAVSVDEARVKGMLLRTIKEPVKSVALEEAGAIVAGGGGIGGGEGFQMLEELAQLLGGTVGASRVPCDEGWVPFSLEIGQTGHIVGPDLYIAVGISGATQHIVGCSDSKRIVVINRDPEAPIFKVADFGVLGDYREVIPALIEQLKALPNL